MDLFGSRQRRTEKLRHTEALAAEALKARLAEEKPAVREYRTGVDGVPR